MIKYPPGYGELPDAIAFAIKDTNPQWSEQRTPRAPAFQRWILPSLYRRLLDGLTPAVALRGPRRVGKTVLLQQIVERLLADGVDSRRILYLPFDDLPALHNTPDPILSIARWYQTHVLGHTLSEAARVGQPAYILFDEIQNLDSWSPQLKFLVDNFGVRTVVTGSSSLRIEAGADSLAGRLTTLEIGPLLLREITGIRGGPDVAPHWVDNGLDSLLTPEFWRQGVEHGRDHASLRHSAFAAFSERGAYPIAHQRAEEPWPVIAEYLNEAVIRRAIQHDLRMGPRGARRDGRLLEEVFLLACRYAGQCPGQAAFVPEIQQALKADFGWTRILNYLDFLDGALLVRLIQPLELRMKRRTSPARICLCDHALRASWLQEIVPLDPAGLLAQPHLTDLAGRLAESIVGYYFASIPLLNIACFPSRAAEPEVDFVLTIGYRRIPIEVKYQRRIDPIEDTRGLRAFLEKSVYNAPFGLLVTLDDNVVLADPRIIPISLSSLLWLR